MLRADLGSSVTCRPSNLRYRVASTPCSYAYGLVASFDIPDYRTPLSPLSPFLRRSVEAFRHRANQAERTRLYRVIRFDDWPSHRGAPEIVPASSCTEA